MSKGIKGMIRAKSSPSPDKKIDSKGNPSIGKPDIVGGLPAGGGTPKWAKSAIRSAEGKAK